MELTLRQTLDRSDAQFDSAEEFVRELPTNADAARSGYIVHIEDNREFSHLTAELLEMSGYRVKVATTGAEALALVDRDPPSLILLDLFLPGGMNGFEFFRELQKRTGDRKIPVIVVSGFTGRHSMRLAHEMGAKGYFPKPFNYDELQEKIHEIVHSRE